MKKCPKCSLDMVEKALFTSTYWECEPCERPPVYQPISNPCISIPWVRQDPEVMPFASPTTYQPILKPVYFYPVYSIKNRLTSNFCTQDGPEEIHYEAGWGGRRLFICLCGKYSLGEDRAVLIGSNGTVTPLTEEAVPGSSPALPPPPSGCFTTSTMPGKTGDASVLESCIRYRFRSIDGVR